jgi:hypothetical protein
MMNWMSFAALFCILVSNTVAAQEPARAELLGNTRVVEDAVEPEFIDLTADELKEQLEVVSSRSYAVYGFNNPEVQIHLPRCDNSIYASVEFLPPHLLDAAGNEVRYELERGIYDHDTHSDEIRFAPADGDQTVAFARAEGSITLRYPIRMRTVAIKPGGPAPAGLNVTIDGPFVSWSDPEEILPEAASFTPVEQFRAFDASRRRLEQNPWKGYSMSGGVSFDTYAFWGEVAEVRIDVVEAWAELEISYSLSSIEPLPAARAGTPPESPAVQPTPGGTVDIRVVGLERPGAGGASRDGLSKIRCELVHSGCDSGEGRRLEPVHRRRDARRYSIRRKDGADVGGDDGPRRGRKGFDRRWSQRQSDRQHGLAAAESACHAVRCD